VAAIAAAFCFWQSISQPWLLVVAPLLCFVRLWFNMLDGMVALASGKASVRGEIVNDLPDRISDVVIFAGVAHSGWICPAIGYWCAIMALITAYVGLFGQAIGCGRQFGGIMSKPWRMVILAIAAWFTFVFRSSTWSIEHFTIFDWCGFIIIAGCAQTIVARLRKILGAVNNQNK
jgi:phosphatidylglycerophosphate synthase